MNATEKAEHALRESYVEEMNQIAMTEGSRLVLQAMIRQELPAAVAQGFREAMSPAMVDYMASAFIDATQRQATKRLDEAAGGLVRKGLKKLAMFAIAGLIVYGIGGWGALAAVLNWLKPGWLK